MTELGPGKEFDTIRRIAAALGAAATELGDDCAFLSVGGEQLALSTDSCVERVHFRREWLTLQEVGWRATAAALSDLAAVGAGAPRVLAALTVPDRSEAEPLMTGVGAAAVSVGGVVIGGNVTHGRELSLTITVVGTVKQPVRRSGARPGDGLWVTGLLGLPRAALQTWLHGGIPAEPARRKFSHPEPRIAAGQWLAAQGASAMLDLSDGLAGDAGHIAAASRCRLEIDLGHLPIAPEVRAAAAASGQAAEPFAAAGGEDYELLVTLPAAFNSAEECLRKTGVPLTRIGSCLASGPAAPPGVILLTHGQPVELRGFDHFA